MPTLRLTLALLLALLALAAVPSALAPASAAAPGSGISGITPAGGYLGNYLAPDGSRVYCIDSTLPWPSGATTSGTPVDDLSTEWGAMLPPTTLAKIAYVLAKYGQTDQAVQAAAVSAYLYAFTSDYARRHGPGVEAGLHYINDHAVVRGAFAGIWNDAEAHANPIAPVATIQIQMSDWQRGTVTVETTPEGATGQLSLSGATFADTGLTAAAVVDGDALPIVGAPGEADPHYMIAADATLTVPASSSGLLLYSTPAQQRTVRAIQAAPAELVARAEVGPLSIPVAPTIVSRVLEREPLPGAEVIDTLTVSLPGGRLWPMDAQGAAIPIIATGTLYGPIPEQPTTAVEPPPGAPVADTQSLTLTAPGEYRSSPTRVDASGWYSWVWRVDAAGQSPAARAVLPEGYAFADAFGLDDETFVIAPQLAATGVDVGAATVLPLAAVVIGLILLVGNTRRRPALR